MCYTDAGHSVLHSISINCQHESVIHFSAHCAHRASSLLVLRLVSFLFRLFFIVSSSASLSCVLCGFVKFFFCFWFLLKVCLMHDGMFGDCVCVCVCITVVGE